MSASPSGQNERKLNWRSSDIERRLFFPGGRFTKVSHVLSAVIALVYDRLLRAS